MGETPAGQHAEGLPQGSAPASSPAEPDPLARLEGIQDVPLAEQVAVFDAIHAHLSSRLTSAES